MNLMQWLKNLNVYWRSGSVGEVLAVGLSGIPAPKYKSGHSSAYIEHICEAVNVFCIERVSLCIVQTDIKWMIFLSKPSEC